LTFPAFLLFFYETNYPFFSLLYNYFQLEPSISSQHNPKPGNSKKGIFDYDAFFNYELDKKRQDKSYRYFNNINRLARSFPTAHTGNGNHVTVWCSNDYLGMSRHPAVIDSMRYVPSIATFLFTNGKKIFA